MSRASRQRAAFRAEIKLKERELKEAGVKTMPITVTLNGYQMDPIQVPIGAHPDEIEKLVKENPLVRDSLRYSEYEMTYSPVSGRLTIATQRRIRIPRMI